MHLVMLETNGNQRYVFSSPRLRESIGASYQLTRLRMWTEDALRDTRVAEDSTQWVSRSSGKVIVRVDTQDQATAVISHVTRRAITEAPGMDISGVWVDMETRTHVDAEALKAVHARAAEYALSRPPALARFSQMPFLARAKDSVLPAAPPLGACDEAKEDRTETLSLPARVKRHLALTSKENLLDRVRIEGGLPDDQLARDVLMLERMLQPIGPENSPAPSKENFPTLSRIAVIHIDGNGVGTIMKDLDAAMKRVPHGIFEKVLDCKPDDPDALRRFLLEVNVRLDDAVSQAFVTAWRKVAAWAEADAEAAGRTSTAVPVVPVILGGDDVTVITSGDYALPFAAAYLEDYECRTGEDDLLRHLSTLDDAEPDGGPMTAAAGVAITGRNYPFHIAYDLAERLVTMAKRVGKASAPARSTLSYHVLFDSTVLDAEQVLHAYKSFTTRPFLLSDDDAPERKDQTSWPTICQRLRAFRDHVSTEADSGAEHFPRTRATRIRRLLSDAAQAELAGDSTRAGDLRETAQREWDDARDVLGADLTETIGDIRSLFDLLELADLLPDSYLGNLLPDVGASTVSRPAEDLA
ncbi:MULTISPECIES: hypothetical protein [Actinomyces]|uniref:Uncharacterized protein n=1 Tax=Actinomyces respiraculi TaxID=2744574 RepID=A0A7T0LL25_9ACTO|nr:MULTISPECIES: hypothetical protein [Actinomyces]QPL05118.1 hypothetical protein ID810_10350 [Actinomyces respiraculi]